MAQSALVCAWFLTVSWRQGASRQGNKLCERRQSGRQAGKYIKIATKHNDNKKQKTTMIKYSTQASKGSSSNKKVTESDKKQQKQPNSQKNNKKTKN